MKKVNSQQENEYRCIICERNVSVGIHIWNQFICQQCEGEMIETEVSDEKYPYFVQRMRKIWLKENA